MRGLLIPFPFLAAAAGAPPHTLPASVRPCLPCRERPRNDHVGGVAGRPLQRGERGTRLHELPRRGLRDIGSFAHRKVAIFEGRRPVAWAPYYDEVIVMNGKPERPEKPNHATSALHWTFVLTVILSLVAGAPLARAEFAACVTNTSATPAETQCEQNSIPSVPSGLLFRIDIPGSLGEPVEGFGNGLGYGEINGGFLAGYLYADTVHDDSVNSPLASTLRMRMRIDDVVFSSDTVTGPVSTSVNFLVDGEIALAENHEPHSDDCVGRIEITARIQRATDPSPVDVATGSFEYSDRQYDPITATGIFLGVTDPNISGTYQTGSFSVPLDDPVSLEFDVLLTAEAESALSLIHI